MNTFYLPDFYPSIFEQSETFIVIGAFDGVNHDDFLTRVKSKTNKTNNKIIFVEPVPRFYAQLLENVSSLSDFEVVCENVGISNVQESVEMVYVKPDLLGKYGWYIEGCSCVVDNNTPINIYMKEVEENDIERLTINTITFNDLLSKNNLTNVDFLQIDTEGYDERIVDSIDFSQFNIKFLKFEKHYLSEGFIDTFVNKLEPLNYSYYWDGENYYFVKNNLIGL